MSHIDKHCINKVNNWTCVTFALILDCKLGTIKYYIEELKVLFCLWLILQQCQYYRLRSIEQWDNW
jgi:hypothetical protein